MKKYFLMLLVLFPFVLSAQEKITVEEYIETYKDIAMREMREHKIPASITLAQGILESGFGNSPLAREAKNHFGIKCHKEWTGKGYYQDDDVKNECFRVYDNPEDSYRDHSEFLTSRPRYADLFKLDIMDYEGWARGLKAAGYATSPTYAEKLIARIELYHLHIYDSLAMGYLDEKKVEEEIKELEKEMETEEVQSLSELAYSPANKAAFELVDMTEDKRFIYENNQVRFIFAKEGETPDDLSKELGIKLDKLCAYNLISNPDDMVFHSGNVVYLDNLRNSNKQEKHYVVAEGETVRDVALRFAVKPEKIRKYNKLQEGDHLTKGQELKLR